MSGLNLSRALLSRIESAAVASLPRECCGMLTGAKSKDGWDVAGVEPSRNIAPDDCCDRFEIDPALLLRLQKAARAGGPRMIGVYHSHPAGEAAPSQVDLAQAWQTGMIWLITALKAGKLAQTRAFLRGEKSFEAVPLRIWENTQ